MDPDPEAPDRTIPHQEATEEVVADVIEAGVGHNNAAITDASVAHALNATFSDTEVEGALNALGGKINLILAALRANGIVDTVS